MKRIVYFAAPLLLAGSALSAAEEVKVDINKISETGVGEKIGTISITQSGKGVTLHVKVTGLPAGEHGFHVHEKGDCAAAMKDGKMTAGAAAGNHYDPKATHTHQGPEGNGHKGDLPLLTATATGVQETVNAPNIDLSEIEGRSLVIHESSDNYTDKPENGGSKGRIACGVVPKKT